MSVDFTEPISPARGFAVPFVRPHFPEASEISEDFRDIVESNWFTNFGPKERKFSAQIADYVGQGVSAITFANATIALICTLRALLESEKPKRLVIVPSFTFAAGPEAIVWAGFEPIFIDIEISTFQPSIADAAALLESRRDEIAGVLLCNTFGIGNGAIDEWEALAKKFSVPLVIDSAAGFGSRYAKGRRVGTAGSAEVFSFHATKPFAIGEGGAVTTNMPGLIEKLKSIQNFGFEATGGAAQLGLNGKLQEINAAIGLRQLTMIDGAIKSRRETLEGYRLSLAGLPLSLPNGIDDSSLCFVTVLLDDNFTRNRLLRDLLASKVEARTYYSPAVHEQDFFKRYETVSALSETAELCQRVLSIPIHPYMDSNDSELLCRTIRRSFDAQAQM